MRRLSKRGTRLQDATEWLQFRGEENNKRRTRNGASFVIGLSLRRLDGLDRLDRLDNLDGLAKSAKLHTKFKTREDSIDLEAKDTGHLAGHAEATDTALLRAIA